MKSWIFKGLAYLATCGAAATTVLLTASSVGLKKSVTEAFPSLSGLIQVRPDVKEELFEPQKPPEPKAAPSGAGQDKSKADQNDSSADDSKKDQANQGNQDNGQGDDDQSQDASGNQSGATGGSAGGMPGGTSGGMECNDPHEAMENIRKALRGLTAQLSGMDQRTNSISSCMTSTIAKALAPPAPAVPGGPGPTPSVDP